MKSTILRVALALAGNAIGLLIAAAVLADMTLDGVAFVIALIIFTVLTAVLAPLVNKVAARNAPALQGGSALIVTFLALLLTALVSDGLSISGVSTWIIATVLVWIVTAIVGIVLAKLVIKNATT